MKLTTLLRRAGKTLKLIAKGAPEFHCAVLTFPLRLSDNGLATDRANGGIGILGQQCVNAVRAMFGLQTLGIAAEYRQRLTLIIQKVFLTEWNSAVWTESCFTAHTKADRTSGRKR